MLEQTQDRLQLRRRTLLQLVAVLCVAITQVSCASGPPPTSTFDITTTTGFSNYRAPLVAFLRGEHATGGAHVCILGLQDATGFQVARIFWPAGQRMAEWGGGASQVQRVLNLKTDVVASQSEVGTSTYLVTRAWVRQMETRCRRHGTQVYLSAAELNAKSAAPSSPSAPRPFAVTTDPRFAGYRAPLVAFLRKSHIKRDTRVCILGMESDEHDVSYKTAWIIWPAGHRMISWNGGKSPMWRVLNLQTDVVPSENSSKSNPHHWTVTPDWVQHMAALCDKQGTQALVTAAELRGNPVIKSP
ncbi:MAG TPA: hypothetical protein VF264_05160 [Rhodanobacteraceae bacterium]